MQDWISSYSKQDVDYVYLIFYDKNKIFTIKFALTSGRLAPSLYQPYIRWYTWEKISWCVIGKDLSRKQRWMIIHEIYVNISKNHNIRYGNIIHKITVELNIWNFLHIEPIGICVNEIIKHNPGGYIFLKDVRFSFMVILDPVTCWFEIFQVPFFDLYEVMAGNKECIDKSSSILIHMFNQNFYSDVHVQPKP